MKNKCINVSSHYVSASELDLIVVPMAEARCGVPYRGRGTGKRCMHKLGLFTTILFFAADLLLTPLGVTSIWTALSRSF